MDSPLNDILAAVGGSPPGSIGYSLEAGLAQHPHLPGLHWGAGPLQCPPLRQVMEAFPTRVSPLSHTKVTRLLTRYIVSEGGGYLEYWGWDRGLQDCA